MCLTPEVKFYYSVVDILHQMSLYSDLPTTTTRDVNGLRCVYNVGGRGNIEEWEGT